MAAALRCLGQTATKQALLPGSAATPRLLAVSRTPSRSPASTPGSKSPSFFLERDAGVAASGSPCGLLGRFDAVAPAIPPLPLAAPPQARLLAAAASAAAASAAEGRRRASASAASGGAPRSPFPEVAAPRSNEPAASADDAEAETSERPRAEEHGALAPAPGDFVPAPSGRPGVGRPVLLGRTRPAAGQRAPPPEAEGRPEGAQGAPTPALAAASAALAREAFLARRRRVASRAVDGDNFVI